MKKIIRLTMLMLGIHQFCIAQTPSSTKVAIGSSYLSTTYIDIYPYQSSAKPAIDNSVHFKMNVGTKFKINAIKDSAGTIQGYVITPWRYNDGISKTKSDSTEKLKFYEKVIKSGQQKIEAQQKLKDSIAKKEATLKIAQDKLLQDSIHVENTKNIVTNVQQITSRSKQLLFNSAVILNSKNNTMIVPKKGQIVKIQLNTFTNLQSKAKAQISKGEEPDSILKKQLISAALVLPLNKNIPIIKYNSDLNSSQNDLKNARQAYNDAVENYKDNKNEYQDSVKELTNLKSNYRHQGQLQNDKLDPYAYKITKEKINDKLDIPKDLTNQAALYDDLAYLDSWANGWLFFISAKDFSDSTVPIFPESHKFTWGFLTLPVKMRFDNDKGGRFDFEQNLNFGLTFGDKHQLISTTDMSLNYLLGLSVVNVPLADSTLKTSATSTTAISTSLGVMFQYDKFQIGIFAGRDFAGSHANQFRYQGKPWLGFAIGVSLFGEGKTTAATETQDSGKP